MLVEVMKSKIHRVKVTETDLNYVGSVSIDQTLIAAAGIYRNQKVQVVNLNNGARLETYVIPAPEGSGVVGLNGAAARWALVGDVLLIIAYGFLEEDKIESFSPVIVFPDENNRLGN